MLQVILVLREVLLPQDDLPRRAGRFMQAVPISHSPDGKEPGSWHGTAFFSPRALRFPAMSMKELRPSDLSGFAARLEGWEGDVRRLKHDDLAANDSVQIPAKRRDESGAIGVARTHGSGGGWIPLAMCGVSVVCHRRARALAGVKRAGDGDSLSISAWAADWIACGIWRWYAVDLQGVAAWRATAGPPKAGGSRDVDGALAGCSPVASTKTPALHVACP